MLDVFRLCVLVEQDVIPTKSSLLALALVNNPPPTPGTAPGTPLRWTHLDR